MKNETNTQEKSGYIKIKPLSVNKAWKGQRFKTTEYKEYEFLLYYKLKPLKIPKGQLEVIITFYLSSTLADIDNPLKPFLDILQKKYGFNDKDIYKLVVNKKIVAKGQEGIEFTILTNS